MTSTKTTIDQATRSNFVLHSAASCLMHRFALAMMCIAIIWCSPIVAASQNAEQVELTGVNMAGAEFKSGAKPGVLFKDYIYPRKDDLNYFMDKGVNVFRLPILWERLQSEPYKKLDQQHLKRIDEVVETASKRHAYVIIDVHNYARYYGQVIGTEEVPDSVLADLWIKLATRYKNNEYVIFGLMNEPNKILATQWKSAADASILAIRETGATNLILIPGTRWSGAHSWFHGKPGQSNAEILSDINDPANNFAIEAHQYLDQDFSGTHAECRNEQIGVKTLEKFTSWLRENDYRGFLGEFGAANNETCMIALENMLEHMDQNADVWLGWSYWAAGSWWGNNYPFNIHPTKDGKDRPQMKILQKHMRQLD